MKKHEIIICPQKDKRGLNKYVRDSPFGRIFYRIENNKYTVYFINKTIKKGVKNEKTKTARKK